MKSYQVVIKEVAYYGVLIEADSADQAKTKAINQHNEKFTDSDILEITDQDIAEVNEIPKQNTK